jgi:hypothetical protein
MAKRPTQSLQWPLTPHQVEVLNSMLETLFREFRRGQPAAEITGILPVANGGSGRATAIPYSVITGGISTTGAHQSVADVGTSGQILTSNGAGALPTWEDAATPVTELDDLTDVTITAPVQGDILVYQEAGDSDPAQWINRQETQWSVLTNGDPVTPEIIFAGGDVVMLHTP